MTTLYRYALASVCGLAALIVARFVIPICLNLAVGVGAELPLPRRFIEAYPQSALGIVLIGGPVLLLVLVGGILRLVYSRAH
jgi:hypothetical protein